MCFLRRVGAETHHRKKKPNQVIEILQTQEGKKTEVASFCRGFLRLERQNPTPRLSCPSFTCTVMEMRDADNLMFASDCFFTLQDRIVWAYFRDSSS
jgi:hypothetical protein